ncbi:MAG: hypothetical protein DRH06_11525 [Deltaproteobacteria bacterium]|nr:MAG: hypothetical protein DRH06_11525 [Deltaproteobacteria bacterium]
MPALNRLEQFDLLKFIDPKLHFNQQTAILFVAAARTSSWFDLLYTGENYRRWLLYLLCLLDDLTEKGVDRIGRWLGVQPKDHLLLCEQLPAAKQFLKFIRQHRYDQGEPKNSDIYSWLNGFSLEVILFLMARSENEKVRKWISFYVTDLRKEKVLLDGESLISLGFAPGRYFQDIFKMLLDARLNHEINTREEEILLVQKKFSPFADSSTH